MNQRRSLDPTWEESKRKAKIRAIWALTTDGCADPPGGFAEDPDVRVRPLMTDVGLVVFGLEVPTRWEDELADRPDQWELLQRFLRGDAQRLIYVPSIDLTHGRSECRDQEGGGA